MTSAGILRLGERLIQLDLEDWQETLFKILNSRFKLAPSHDEKPVAEKLALSITAGAVLDRFKTYSLPLAQPGKNLVFHGSSQQEPDLFVNYGTKGVLVVQGLEALIAAGPAPENSAGHPRLAPTVERFMSGAIGDYIAFQGNKRIAWLHASASLVEERAWLFLGPSGRGKSTLATNLAALGFPRLADDMAPVDLKSSQMLESPEHRAVTGGPWPIGGLFLLEQGPSLEIRPIDKEAAYAMLFEHRWGARVLPRMDQLEALQTLCRLPLGILQAPLSLAGMKDRVSALLGATT